MLMDGGIMMLQVGVDLKKPWESSVYIIGMMSHDEWMST